MNTVSDANAAPAAPSASSALETALNGSEISNTPTDTAPPSAETLNTGTTEQGQEDKVPWHKDPRWQSWQSERQELSTRAERAQIWDRALSEHPEFAKKVLSIIEELSQGKVQEQPVQQTEYDPIAEKLLGTKAFGSLKKELDEVKNALQMGAQELSGQKKETTVNRYKADFGEYIKDFDVYPDYQEIFEERVWKELQKLSPESVKNYAYDPQAFKKAVESEKERYKKLTNGITSNFTRKAEKQQVPQTGKGGLTPLSNSRSAEEETSDFVNQLKSLR